MRRFQLYGICCLLVLLGAGLQRYISLKVSGAGPTWSARKFYLTKNDFAGNQVLKACAVGYHMASLWEIYDVSTLQYDTTLGQTNDDAGSGPPSTYSQALTAGWIRTGSRSTPSSATNGQANCSAWTSNSPSDSGTIVGLNSVWDGPGNRFPAPWLVVPMQNPIRCSAPRKVWCVQD